MSTTDTFYTCERCGYQTKYKPNLVKHLKRANICAATTEERDIPAATLLDKLVCKSYNEVTYDCIHCKRKFNNRSSMYRHLKTCKVKNTFHTESEHSEDLREQLRQMQEKIDLLMSTMNKAQQPSTNTTNISNSTINYNLQVNSFGNENMEHITHDFLTDCVLQQNDGLKNFFAKLHGVPENNNIRVKSTKQNLLECFTNGSWIPCDKNNTLDSMIRRGYRILWSHFINNMDVPYDSEVVIQEYFMKLGSKADNMYYQLRRDLYLMIYNNTLYVVGA
jgi:hypothetical protein